MTGSLRVEIARLPRTGGELFGRAEELAWLEACWRERVHVASVVAFGGVGKTSLLTRWLAGKRDEGWDGAARVYYWSFYRQGTGQLGSADEFINATLSWFGDADPTLGSLGEKGARLARLVREERTLLVLDGVEPLQWGPGVQEGELKDQELASLVRALAAQNQGLCLITSRIKLTDLDAMRGDKVRAKDLNNLSPEAGAELLRARGVKGAEEELRAASKEFKGHGLALTLLGSYLDDVAKGDILKRKEIGPLIYDERQGGHARRVMTSYEPWLGQPEVAILRMIGLFDRPVDEGEIAALRAEPLVNGLTDALVGVGDAGWNKAVSKLQRAGLLLAEQDNRLDAHPLVREHFGEQFKRDNVEAWREGHRRLYVYLKDKAKPLPDTIEEMAPLYAAVVHGCLAGKHQEALVDVHWTRIRRANEGFSWRKLGAFGSEVAVLSAFFDPPWERLAPGLGESFHAFFFNAAGFTLRALGRLREAAGLMRQSMDRDIAQQSWKNAASNASSLSALLLSVGEGREALEQARKSVELADTSGNAFMRIASRTALAAALHAMALREEAAAQFEEGERMQKDSEPAYPRLYALQGFWYCDLLLDQGRDAEMRERAEQALAIAASNNWLLDIALAHVSLGRAHLFAAQLGSADELTWATSHLEQAVDGLRRAGQQDYLPVGLLARAALHIHTHDFAAARHDLDETLTLATRCGFRLHEADAHLGLTRLAIENKPAPAHEHLAIARSIVDQTGYHRRDEEIITLTADLASRPTPTSDPTTTPAPLPAQPLAPEPRPGVARPMPQSPLTARSVDVGILVALPEELRELLDLAGPYDALSDRDLDAYLFTRGNYRCAVTLVGEMGQAQAAVFTDRLITALDPGCLVSIGIAGGIHDDLRVGDVHIPSQAVEYLQDGKATPTPDGGFAFKPGAPAYRADFALLKGARSFEFRYAAEHRRWKAECTADLAALLTDPQKRASLVAESLVRAEVALLADGHVATGPVVGAAAAFSAWIRSHDRNVKSIEMESAAVLLAAQTRHDPRRAIAIRAISDYGDERKQALDRIGGGSLRRYAMRNAVRLLWALLDADALPRADAAREGALAGSIDR